MTAIISLNFWLRWFLNMILKDYVTEGPGSKFHLPLIKMKYFTLSVRRAYDACILLAQRILCEGAY